MPWLCFLQAPHKRRLKWRRRGARASSGRLGPATPQTRQGLRVPAASSQ